MNRRIAIIAILLLAAMSLWFVSRPESSSQQMPEMVYFDPSKVDTISLRGEGVESFSLQRSTDGWTISGGQKAEIDAVNHLLDDLADMQIVRVVTRNPDHYAELGIGSGSVHLSLKAGESELLRVDIGRQGKDLLSTYLRIGDRPEVLAVNKTLLWQVRRAKDGWRAAAPAPQAAQK